MTSAVDIIVADPLDFNGGKPVSAANPLPVIVVGAASSNASSAVTVTNTVAVTDASAEAPLNAVLSGVAMRQCDVAARAKGAPRIIIPPTIQSRYFGCMRLIAFNLALALLPFAAHASSKPAPATVSTCFTPGPESCAEQIVDRIDEAHLSVRVQAYYLTQPLILRAIATAKRRGLDVEVILDKSQDRRNSSGSRYSGATYLANAGVSVWIDDAPAIAHSKIIILDDRLVLTGSFNFTKSADTRNAENVVIIDSTEVAAHFTRNWEVRRSASRKFETE